MVSSPAIIAFISFIYRISINLPDVPYSAELKKTGSEEFKEISQRIFDSINFSLKDVPGFYNLTVKEFRYQQVIGTLASLEILSTTNNGKEIRRIFEEAINSGHLNWLPVAPEGFEFYEFKVNRTKNGKYDLHAAKPTVTCPDGALPEYSLHGSTYCWSHSVCPSGTACIQSQCCKTAIADQLRKCHESEWECGDGRCLHLHKRCDGLNDCTDRSDEILCENEKRSIGRCASGEYQCDSGECVPKHKQCDRHYDCQDGTDELKCDYFINAQRSQPNENQGHRRGNHDEQFHENSIHSRPEVVEQTVCTDQEFRCPHLSVTKCVHYDKLCDGVNDCGDNSDETKCESGSIEDRKCEHGEFQCSNGQCISETKKCNRHYDCDDGTDETECEYFKAASSRQQNNRQNGGHAENNEIQERERQLALREEEESRREAEERRRENEERRREHEDRRREEEFRQREEESQRRNKEERDRLEEERRRQEQQSNRIQENVIQVSGEHEVRFKEEYDEDECLEHEFMCGTGECIDRRRVCDTRPDCLDSSDEHDCDGDNNHDRIWPDRTEPPRTEAPTTHAPLEQRPHPSQGLPHQHPDTHRIQAHEDIQITIYPHELSVRDGRDGSFECRARTTDNSIYPEVRWTRVGGPLPSSAYESSGRLTLNPVSLADAGRYVCVATYNGRSVEAYATLHVQSYGPQELQHGGYQASSGGSCMADEKLCGTSECVKSDYVCDGEPDCRDRSDESNCPAKRLCEPNEFKCDNDRCVQKMWLCDGDDDCGDGSDERNCEAKKPGELCQGTEFRCNDNRQCIPRSFQCDGTNDCHDGSDEVGCIQPTVVQPPETQKQVPQGQTFKLNCKAVAVPEPYINWRLNWGPVCDPPRCVQESEGGVGTLTVHNAQPLDQGAYTCEAINVKGRVLATPDCIVRIVDQPLPPPPPPPTQPPRPSIQCDSVGSVTPYPDTRGQCQCKPLVVGPTCQECRPGTYHLDGNAPQGCLKCFCFGITDQCRSSNWYRTKEKLYFNGDSEGITLSTIDLQERPSTFDYSIPGKLTHRGTHNECLFWNLPQRFRGNKVTAYGGKMAFELQYSGSGVLSDQPIVVLKGNGITLVHRAKDTYQFQSDRAFTYTVETYEKNYEHLNGNPASREDLMMVLADLDAYLIRATHVQSQISTSLGDVSWEIAVDRDTQEGLALEVEQCVCPPGYIGTSCEDCAPGYERSGQGPYLGTCVLRRRCECNGHSSSCDNEYGYCHNCQHNTEGDQCERCKPGYEGDARRGTPQDCQPVATRPPCECNNHSPRGCDSFGRCLLCEHSTEGYHCETCKKGFYGDATRGTPYDCTPCPCPGASECFLDQNGQVQCRNCPAGYSGRVCDACAPGYTRSQKTGGRDCEPIGRVQEDRIQFVDHPEARLRVEILPPKHLSINQGSRAKWTCQAVGVKPETVTIKWTKIGVNEFPPHVVQSGHQLIIDEVQPGDQGQYRCTGTTHNAIATDEASLSVIPGTPPKPVVTPPHQTVNENQQAVFTCIVPGVSDCEVQWHFNRVGSPLPPGVHRRGNQIVIPVAQKNHAGSYICTVRTQFGLGESNPGVLDINRAPWKPRIEPPEQTVDVGDPARFRCWVPGVPHAELEWRPSTGGRLPDGVEQSHGILNVPRAQQHHQGQYICSARDPQDVSQPEVDSDPARLNVRAPEAPLQPQVDPLRQTVDLGQPARFRCWVPGNPHAQLKWTTPSGRPLPSTARDSHGSLEFPAVQESDVGEYICEVADPRTGQPVRSPPARLDVRKPQVPQVDPPEQTVNEDDPARFRCWVPGNPEAQLRWGTRGGGPLPQGAHDDGRGQLSFPRTTSNHEGEYECTAVDPRDPNRTPYTSQPANLHVRKQMSPEVDPPEQTVNENEPSRIRCWVRDNPHARLSWSRKGGQPLTPDARDDGRGTLSISRTQLTHEGDYECTAIDPSDPNRTPHISDPARINVRKTGKPPRPVATPPLITVKHGDPASFHCDANSDTPAEIHWGFGRDVGPLRGDVIQEGDDVVIDSADDLVAGEYVCTATNEFGSGRSEPVRLVVTESENPPTARVEPKVWNGKPGDRHQLRCHTTGIPTPEVSWTGPGGNPIAHDVTDLGGGVLEFASARKEHEGEYTCHAVNSVGEASDTGTIHLGPSIGVRTDPAGPTLVLIKGQPLEVKCEAFGDPDPEVEWLHDPGPERGDLPDDFKPVTISEQFIRHPSIGLGNAGNYTCKGSNAHGIATKTITIKVVDAGHVSTVSVLGGTTQYFPVNQASQLICAATGSRLVDRIEWVRVDGSLPPEVEEHNEQGLLHFGTFLSSYSGEYECRGYRKDELIGTSRVTVYPEGEFHEDGVRVEISPPKVRVVNEGDSIVLDCSVHGHEGDVSYDWSLARGGSLVRQLGEEAQLVVKSADPTNDYGVYRCEVSDENAKPLGSASTAVTVGFNSESKAEEAKFDEFSDATLVCPVYTVPGAIVTWNKVGEDLPDTAEQQGNKLLIKDFDDSTTGLYTCSVEYDHNRVEGYVNAKIFVPDTISKVVLNVSSENVAVGERAWLDCTVTGDPDAKIEFSKEDSDKLPSNAQVTGTRLLFTSVTEENSGKYKCRAITKDGPLETTAIIYVGNAKRKRKHLHSRNTNNRLNSQNLRRNNHVFEQFETTASRRLHRSHKNEHKHKKDKEKNHHHSIFGEWFESG